MVSNVATDLFTLLLEANWQDGRAIAPLRAVATNIATKMTAEAQLSMDQAHMVIEHGYKEPTITEIYSNP